MPVVLTPLRNTMKRHQLGTIFLCCGLLLSALLADPALSQGSGGSQSGNPKLPVATTINDFFQPGTQPNTLLTPIAQSENCLFCHSNYDPDQEPYTRWAASMMGQAGRDPIFYACLAIANQDAKDSGDMCLRCHAPGAWLSGRSTPTDGSALDAQQGDFDGVTCHLCHRMVDPVHDVGIDPPQDRRILGALQAHSPIPEDAHNGQYVIDPIDRRRGPFELVANFSYHDWIQSSYHQDSSLCATCHDVSNPIYARAADGSYRPNEMDTPAEVFETSELFPIERTFSEWELSSYGVAALDNLGIETDGRFGGDKTQVSSCQDCHMPDTSGRACSPVLADGLERDDLPLHDFNGVNSWVLEAIRSQHPDDETGLTDESVAAANLRTLDMQSKAADLYAFVQANELTVRVVNHSGHKLPTGYSEGRAMWLNVRFLDAQGTLLDELGAYDDAEARIDRSNTTVFEALQGLDQTMADVTGLPVGESFHFVLNNAVVKDNRIPPRGYRFEPFARAGAAPVAEHFNGSAGDSAMAAGYEDEQYWHDSRFSIPAGTASVNVRLLHQTTTREYIEFLRDENKTNGAGQTAYDLWVQFGKSAPVEKQVLDLDLGNPSCPDPLVYGLGQLRNQAKGEPGTERLELAAIGNGSVQQDYLILDVRGGRPDSPGAIFYADGMKSQNLGEGTRYLSDYSRNLRFRFDALGRAQVSVPLESPLVGTVLNYQVMARDPLAMSGFLLSNGLRVDFCP